MKDIMFPANEFAVSGIYKITNKANGKIYIGQSVNIQNRLYKHRRETADDYFHRALRKYGKDNFTYEIIEKCEKDFLNEREKYWISFYKSNVRKYGYNMTPGGDGAPTKQVCQYSKKGSLIKIFSSITEASLKTGIPMSNICAACKPDFGRKSAGGYQWRYEDIKNLSPYEFNQEKHLQHLREQQAIKYKNKEWRNKEGRPTKEKEVKEWRQKNPNGTKAECIRETGISDKTVYKYWKNFLSTSKNE